MNLQSLFEKYPWYQSHRTAVDTTARWLAVPVEEILPVLDGKIRPVTQDALDLEELHKAA